MGNQFTTISGGDSFLYHSHEPFFVVEVLLNRPRHDPGPRAINSLSQTVELIEGFLIEPDRSGN